MSRYQQFFAVFLVVYSLFVTPLTAQVVLLEEDFEGLPLGPFVDEKVVNPGTLDPAKVWTNVPPAGWEIEDLAPEGGVRDWRAWSFTNNNAWAFVAGDQRRTEFTKGVGTIAVSDSDEFDDKPNGDGTYNSIMNTPPISIAGAAANSIDVKFDSSWRPEGNQTAILTVSYDGGPEQDVLFWTSTDGDAFFKDDNSTNDTLVFRLDNPANANSMVLSFQQFEARNNWWWAIDNIVVSSGSQILFKEDFEGLALGPFLDESLPANINSLDPNKVWTPTPPANWTKEFSAPDTGVTEWRGWNFANNSAWAQVDDQRRSEFKKGSGTIAVADPDEWDDMGNPASQNVFNAKLNTPAIDISSAAANAIELTFDSSWRPESPQRARLSAIYNGGAPVVIFDWSSVDGEPGFKNDSSTNDTLTYNLMNPAGATQLVIVFELYNAGNNWWWAIDNIRVVDTSRVQQVETVRLPLFEDFEGLALRDSIEEELAASGVWTNQPPAGWNVDRSGVFGAEQGLGVDEWIGWSFANKDWWAQTAGDQQRTQFTNGAGTVAVADPDEWDDLDDPDSQGSYTSFLSTPNISLTGASANSLVLEFDSSYRQEEPTNVNITVAYDGGTQVEILRWTWVTTDANFHPDAPNETIILPLNNPAGASSMVVTWGMLEARNDWWWAVDNVSITASTSVDEWSLY